MSSKRADVAIIMGSQSDWATMRHAAETLDALGISPCQARSSRRTARPTGSTNSPRARATPGFKVIIAGAGGAAHLPGMTAALTSLPVFGVPVESKALSGQDSLYSIVQMPAGIPVGTLAIGKAGAINAALLAAAVLALSDAALAGASTPGAPAQTAAVAEQPVGRRNEAGRRVAAAGRDDRHHRRRPARPHAGDGRRPPRLPHRHPRAAGRLPGRAGRQPADRRRL